MEQLIGAPLYAKEVLARQKGLKQRIENITSADDDWRQYRGLVLENRVNALLVEDTKTLMGAVALNVNIGSMSDPKDVQGLAHALEHCIFLNKGDIRRPEVSAFDKFVQRNGGTSNAETTDDHTSYFFEIDSNMLGDALNLFFASVKGPWFRNEDKQVDNAIEAEMRVIDSEFQLHSTNDWSRLDQLQRSLSTPGHPYSNFACGNLKTLVENQKDKTHLRKAMVKFHNRNYPANFITLCVIGNLPLNILETFVLDSFGQLDPHNSAPPSWPHPFGPSQVGRRVEVVPIKQRQFLRIVFPFEDLMKHRSPKHEKFIEYLFSGISAGSLYHKLVDDGLASSLDSRYRRDASGFGVWMIEIDLTEDGLLHCDTVLQYLFAFVNFLKGSHSFEVFDDCKKLFIEKFHAKDETSAMEYAKKCASSLHQYNGQEFGSVLFGDYDLADYQAASIDGLLCKMLPRNMMYFIVSPTFSSQANMQEAWYGTRYRIADIPEETLRQYENAAVPDGQFRLPSRNRFIPDQEQPIRDFNFDRVRTPAIEQLVVDERNRNRNWFKQDDIYFTKKCFAIIRFRSSVGYATPANAALNGIFVQFIKEAMADILHDASEAGVEFSLTTSEGGITTKMGGTYIQQHVLVQQLAVAIMNLEVDDDFFDSSKTDYLDDIEKLCNKKPYELAAQLTYEKLSKRHWTNDELKKAAQGLTMDALVGYVKKWTRTLFIDGLFFGNIIKEEVMKIVEYFRPLLELCDQDVNRGNFLPILRDLSTFEGGACLHETTSPVHSESAVVVTFLTNEQEDQLCSNRMLIKLIARLLESHFYEQLRVKEQLGYVMDVDHFESQDDHGVTFLVQTHRSLEHIERRLDSFLSNFEKRLKSRHVKDDLESQKAAMIKYRCGKFPNLIAHGNCYWDDIEKDNFNFTSVVREKEALEGITLDDVVNFFKTSLVPGAPKRRKLIVRVFGSRRD